MTETITTPTESEQLRQALADKVEALTEQIKAVQERRSAFEAEVAALTPAERGLPVVERRLSSWGHNVGGIDPLERLPKVGETIWYYVQDEGWDGTSSPKTIEVTKVTDKSVVGTTSQGGTGRMSIEDKHYEVQSTVEETIVLKGMTAEMNRLFNQRHEARQALYEAEEQAKADRQAAKAAEIKTKREAQVARYLAVFGAVEGRLSDAVLEQFVTTENVHDLFGGDLVGRQIEDQLWGAANAPRA